MDRESARLSDPGYKLEELRGFNTFKSADPSAWAEVTKHRYAEAAGDAIAEADARGELMSENLDRVIKAVALDEAIAGRIGQSIDVRGS